MIFLITANICETCKRFGITHTNKVLRQNAVLDLHIFRFS